MRTWVVLPFLKFPMEVNKDNLFPPQSAAQRWLIISCSAGAVTISAVTIFVGIFVSAAIMPLLVVGNGICIAIAYMYGYPKKLQTDIVDPSMVPVIADAHSDHRVSKTSVASNGMVKASEKCQVLKIEVQSAVGPVVVSRI